MDFIEPISDQIEKFNRIAPFLGFWKPLILLIDYWNEIDKESFVMSDKLVKNFWMENHSNYITQNSSNVLIVSIKFEKIIRSKTPL